MTPLTAVSLGVVGLVFLLWNAAMFHMLWTLSRRAKDRSAETGDGYSNWFGHSLNIFLHALTSNKDRTLRRRIVLLSVLLALSIAVFTVLKTRGL